RSLPARIVATPNVWMVGLPALVGRTIMVLGGAFFLRALTDTGALPAGTGVAVGIAYALAWVAMSDRAARAGRAPDATAHGLATTLIAFPLVWETTTRFGLLSPTMAAFTLTAVAGIVLFVAWLRRLGLLAWIVTLTSTMTGVALLFATKSLPLFSVTLCILAVASLAASFHREWYGLRWPGALALDLLVILAMYLMGKTNYQWLRPPELAAVQLLMAVAYLGIIGVRTIVLGHPTREFGIVQSSIVLAIGFEGARRVLGPEHVLAGTFGPVALLLAATCYAAAFARFERDPDQRANWTWYLTLGTLLAAYSAALLAEGHVVGLLYGILALAGAYCSRPEERSALRWNTMGVAIASAIASGIVGGAYMAFFAADPLQWLQLPAAVWGTAALCLAAWILSRWPRPAADQALDRTMPGLALLVVAAIGVGSTLVAWIAPGVSAAGTPAADAGTLAVLRTTIVCASSLLFAGLSRLRRHPELVWMAYGALGAAACKIAIDDLPNGRPMTIFMSFILFGGAMILSPRLVPEPEETRFTATETA
ncbi:MAG TPA: hypothetical protein VFO62_06325, partial [Candidatus Binatia bacterium]|nr:hypothetical protein [Candidatus Binatia bacterium]